MLKQLLSIHEKIILEKLPKLLSRVISAASALAGGRGNSHVSLCDPSLLANDDLRGVTLEVLFVILNFDPLMRLAAFGGDFFKFMQT